VLKWLHLSAAGVALGGAAFSLLALIPAAKATLADDLHDKLREAIRCRWAKFVHMCIAILLVTGSLQFALVAIPPKINPLPYHPIFGAKFFAAMGIFIIASILVGRGEGFAHMRRDRVKWIKVMLALGGLVVLLGGALEHVRLHQPARAPMPAAPSNTP
jgi:uncharacterized membrane protein